MYYLYYYTQYDNDSFFIICIFLNRKSVVFTYLINTLLYVQIIKVCLRTWSNDIRINFTINITNMYIFFYWHNYIDLEYLLFYHKTIVNTYLLASKVLTFVLAHGVNYGIVLYQAISHNYIYPGPALGKADIILYYSIIYVSITIICDNNNQILPIILFTCCKYNWLPI